MRAMSFSKSILYGIKLYFLFSLTIGLAFFIDIQRNDIKGDVQNSYYHIIQSIEILTIAFPILTFYVGSKQSNLIKRKTDSGFAAAVSSCIGFLMILYLNWAIILGSLTVAGSSNEPIFNNLINGEYFNDLIWRIIPAILASIFSSTTNHQINTKTKRIESKKSEDTKENNVSESPWIYSVGTVDEHGFEWIKHNNIQWYRAVNSGDEWIKYI